MGPVSQRAPWDEVGSAGVVASHAVRLADVRLSSGAVLPHIDVVYETYGELSPQRDNAILVCHALSGDAHVAGWREADARAAGWTPEQGDDWNPAGAATGDPDAAPASAAKPGWWDPFVGPGKTIDTEPLLRSLHQRARRVLGDDRTEQRES